MTTQTNPTRPQDSTIPYPALHHDGDYTWKPASKLGGILLGLAVTVAFVVASIYVQVIAEGQYVLVIARVIELPAVLFTGVGVLVGLVMTVVALMPNAPWFQDWSYLEVREEDNGLRVFAGRLGKNHPGILVRRNETIEISGSREDALDEATLKVVAPSGDLEVDVDTFLTSVTMGPLDEAAARYGIEIRLVGVATEIPRSSKA